MSKFYKFKPVDTLFFRGASSANMGEDHSAVSIFPPPSETIAGAIRTTFLIQNSISFNEYGDKKFNNKGVISKIGKAGKKAPFNIIGPLFMKGTEIFIPAPYSWYFYSKGVKKELLKNGRAKVKIVKLKKIETDLIKTSEDHILWVKPSDNENDKLDICGGLWVKFNDLYSDYKEKEVFTLSFFVKQEIRTGIGINYKTGIVREGHLYSFNHYRLLEDVYLIFGIDKDVGLEKKGILKLGAEQRFGMYEEINIHVNNQNINSELFMSLSLVDGSNISKDEIFATGKIIYLGGWDMNKMFHKPMKGYFPAGTVFKRNINNNFIEIKEV